MSSLPNPKYTVEEYFELERTGDIRHEYHHGEIFAMAGASFDHARIVQNLSRSLGNDLASKGTCEVVTSDVRVRINDLSYVYPDIVVVCGTPEIGHHETLLNPSVVFEVLSDSTQDYDQNKKFEFYQKIPSLTDYLLVSQDRVRIVHHKREGQSWRSYHTTIYTELIDDVVIESLDCTLRVDEIYERVTFPREDTA